MHTVGRADVDDVENKPPERSGPIGNSFCSPQPIAEALRCNNSSRDGRLTAKEETTMRVSTQSTSTFA